MSKTSIEIFTFSLRQFVKFAQNVVIQTSVPNWTYQIVDIRATTVCTAEVNLKSKLFAPGQAYFVLSRVRSLIELRCLFDLHRSAYIWKEYNLLTMTHWHILTKMIGSTSQNPNEMTKTLHLIKDCQTSQENNKSVQGNWKAYINWLIAFRSSNTDKNLLIKQLRKPINNYIPVTYWISR
jgi:hypothetical protein